MSEITPSHRFTGLFIPAELFEIEEITMTEAVLLSFIDSLFCKKSGGCFASNAYLAKRTRVKENTVVKAITKLRRLDLVEDISFDGRRRVIRAKIAEWTQKAQKTPLDEIQEECDLNPMQGVTKILPTMGFKSYPSYIYNKGKKQLQEECDKKDDKSDVVVLSKIKEESLEPLDIPLKEKKLIAKKYADLEDDDFTSKLTAGVEYFEKQVGLGKSANLAAIIKQAFNGNWKPINSISTTVKEKNIAYLETISHLSEKRVGGYHVSVGKDYVSLNIASSGVEFTANDPLMIEKYETMMDKISKQAKKDEMAKQERELKLRNAII